MRPTAVRILLLLALLFVSAGTAQGYLAAGTYGLAATASFRNGSAFFAGNPSLTVTDGLLDVDENEVDVIIQLRITAGDSEALFTTGGQIGATASGQLLISIFDCQENVLAGGGFGFSLCAVAQQANGCAAALNWGQGTTNSPFVNRTLIVTDGLCGLVGTQLWRCGAAGACNGATGSLAALPTGTYNIYGERPAFVLDNPQGIIPALVNASLIVSNNFEHMLTFDFNASPASVTVKLAGAAVLDTRGELLFSYSSCSQANSGGPVAFQLCNLFDSEQGCEISTPSSQFDVAPPDDVTAILIGNAWCSFSGTFNYLCDETAGPCEGPINNGAAAALGINAGNCLRFTGNTINFDSTSGGCVITSLQIDNLFVNNSNIQNQVVINQQVTNQTVTEQTVINQDITNQTVTQQTVINQVVNEQTVLQQNIVNQTVESITVNNLQISTTTSFIGISGLNGAAGGYSYCGNAYWGRNGGCFGNYPMGANATFQRVGDLVMGTLSFYGNNQPPLPTCEYQTLAGVMETASGGCSLLGTRDPAVPPDLIPSRAVVGISSAIAQCNLENCLINLRFQVDAAGRMLWWPIQPDNNGNACCQGTEDYGLGGTNIISFSDNFVGDTPDKANVFTFSYVLPPPY